MQALPQLFPCPPTKWTAANVPDLFGRVIIVTGGNSGVGKEITKVLLEKRAKVYIASRSQARVKAAITELRYFTGMEAIFLELDLADLSSVRRAAAKFLELEPNLHVLFNNAGVMATPPKMLSKDGYDLQWGTNVMSHWLFMQLLMPALERGALSSPDQRSRVVHTSSLAIYAGATISFDTLIPGPTRNRKSRMDLHKQSKAANVVVTLEAVKRYAGKGVVFTATNPGFLKTEITRHETPMQRLSTAAFLSPAAYGALPELFPGTAPKTRDADGKLFVPWTKEGKIPTECADPEVGRQLWEWLESETAHKGL